MVFTHYIPVELALREDIEFFPTALSEKHRLAVSTDPHDGAGSLRKPSKREPSRAELSATWRELTKPRSKSLELQG